MKNKLFLGSLAAAVAVPVMVAPVAEAKEEVKSPFTDVPKSSSYFDIIHEMRDEGIINGYPDGTFKPSVLVSRKHVASLLARALPLEPVRDEKAFTDVSKNDPYYNVIQKVQRAGIIDGDTNGNFNPDKPLTRVQMAKILDLAFDLKVKAEYDFPDVPTTHWGNKHVRALYSNGITLGDGGYFKPNEAVSRAHYAVFLHRLLNIDEDFVAPPIETPKPEPKPGDEWENPIKYHDVHEKDIPRPDGYVEGVHEKKNEAIVQEIIIENGHGFRSSFTINSDSPIYGGSFTFEEMLKSDAEILGVNLEDYVRIINKVIETGEVYDGKTFTVYFDYRSGLVTITGVRNHTTY